MSVTTWNEEQVTKDFDAALGAMGERWNYKPGPMMESLMMSAVLVGVEASTMRIYAETLPTAAEFARILKMDIDLMLRRCGETHSDEDASSGLAQSGHRH